MCTNNDDNSEMTWFTGRDSIISNQYNNTMIIVIDSLLSMLAKSFIKLINLTYC